jgi:hypothetical protein
VRNMRQECCFDKGQGLKRWSCSDVNDHSDAESIPIHSKAAYSIDTTLSRTTKRLSLYHIMRCDGSCRALRYGGSCRASRNSHASGPCSGTNRRCTSIVAHVAAYLRFESIRHICYAGIPNLNVVEWGVAVSIAR